MSLPSIDDVRVRDKAAWKAAIAELRKQREVHPVDRIHYPDGIGETLVTFVVHFAVKAQKKIETGESFADFAWDLADAVEPPGQIANVGMYMVADLLREHWVHGELIEEWIPKRSE